MPTDLHSRGERLHRQNPALRKPDWLPHGLWPELDELHDRHVKLISDLSAATGALRDLRRSYEEEDEGRTQALTNGKKGPKPTDEAARQSALSEASAKANAAHRALLEFLPEAVDLIQEKESEWLAACDSQKARADEKRQEALRLLDEADRDVWGTKSAEAWVKRTAQNKAMRHVSYEQLGGSAPASMPRHEVNLDQLTGRA